MEEINEELQKKGENFKELGSTVQHNRVQERGEEVSPRRLDWVEGGFGWDVARKSVKLESA